MIFQTWTLKWVLPDMLLMEFSVMIRISSQDRVTLKSKTRINKWPDYIAEQVTWLHCTASTGQASPANKGKSHKLCLLEYYICKPSFCYYANCFCHHKTYKVLTIWDNNCIMGGGTICDCVKSYWPSSSGHMREGPIMFTDLVPK